MRKPRFKMVLHLIHRTTWHQLLRILILPHPQTRDHNSSPLIEILYRLDEEVHAQYFACCLGICKCL